MKFENGLPADNGATDFMDSARLAGLLALFGHPDFDPSLLLKYIVTVNGKLLAVRNPDQYPANNPLNFTRDQLICLAAGLATYGKYPSITMALLQGAIDRGYRAQNTEADIPGSTKKFPNGADILTPSNMNHLRICAGQKPKLLGRIWLVADILFNAVFTPLAEPNQLMAQCKIAGQRYVKLLRITNRKLDQAIREYWTGWRGEPELAEFLIQKFQ